MRVLGLLSVCLGMVTAQAQVVQIKNKTICTVLSYYRPESITITNCTFNMGGIVIYGGGFACGSVIDIERNSFINCRTAIQLNGVVYDPHVMIKYNQITGDDSTPRNDQISVYQSSGSEVRSIVIAGNYLQGSPNAPQVPFAGGIVLDAGSNYVLVSDNVCVDIPIGMSAGQGLTSVIVGNIVVGTGPAGAWTGGIYMDPNTGYVVGNTSGWINKAGTPTLNNYVVVGGSQSLINGNGNTNLTETDIPGARASLFWRWAIQMVADGAWPVGN